MNSLFNNKLNQFVYNNWGDLEFTGKTLLITVCHSIERVNPHRPHNVKMQKYTFTVWYKKSHFPVHENRMGEFTQVTHLNDIKAYSYA